jgi:hypothetical protein
MPRPHAPAILYALLISLTVLSLGCDDKPKPYGVETGLAIPDNQTHLWAIAPAINLSGHHEVDPILQADLLYTQLQMVKGMTVVPVDRVVQVFAAMEISQIQSPQQARAVCEALNVEGIIIPTITAYDSYMPPKMAASLALFTRGEGSEGGQGGEATTQPSGAVAGPHLRQVVGIYDSQNGTVRKALLEFAAGRSDPNGPMSEREYFLSMDRYSGFVYHQLIADLLGVPAEPKAQDGKDQATNDQSTAQ